MRLSNIANASDSAFDISDLRGWALPGFFMMTDPMTFQESPNFSRVRQRYWNPSSERFQSFSFPI